MAAWHWVGVPGCWEAAWWFGHGGRLGSAGEGGHDVGSLRRYRFIVEFVRQYHDRLCLAHCQERGWGILASAPHISSAGCRTRNTTKCDIEKFTTKPARMAAPFAASTGMNFAAITRTVVLTSAPSTPDVTNVP
jgi:hypothetical protein